MFKKLIISAALSFSLAQCPLALAQAEPTEGTNVEMLQEKIAQGDLVAQTYLAMRYIDGDGVPQDKEKGIELLQDAADKNEPLAQLALGVAYVMGTKGVSEDLAQAEVWLTKAADQGNEMAQEILDEIRQNK